MRSERARTLAGGAWFPAPHRRLAAWSSLWSMWQLGPCSAAPSSGPMMNRPGGRSNRSVAPADSAGVACGAAAPRGPTRGSRGSRRIRRERCSEGASCCDADGCSRASVRAPQRRSRRALARRGRLGAPAARAGARGRASAGQISRADALERTARPAGTQQPRRSCARRRGGSGTISPTGRFPSRPETMSQRIRAF